MKNEWDYKMLQNASTESVPKMNGKEQKHIRTKNQESF